MDGLEMTLNRYKDKIASLTRRLQIKGERLARTEKENDRLRAELDSTRADLKEGFKTVAKIQDENDSLRAALRALREEEGKG